MLRCTKGRCEGVPGGPDAFGDCLDVDRSSSMDHGFFIDTRSKTLEAIAPLPVGEDPA